VGHRTDRGLSLALGSAADMAGRSVWWSRAMPAELPVLRLKQAARARPPPPTAVESRIASLRAHLAKAVSVPQGRG